MKSRWTPKSSSEDPPGPSQEGGVSMGPHNTTKHQVNIPIETPVLRDPSRATPTPKITKCHFETKSDPENNKNHPYMGKTSKTDTRTRTQINNPIRIPSILISTITKSRKDGFHNFQHHDIKL